MKAIWQAIFDSPMKHGAIPAHGGMAYRLSLVKSSPVKEQQTPDDLNREFLKSKKEQTGYRGFRISRTAQGEYFSSLDPDSWYESLGQCKRAIDGFLKGRAA